MTLGKAFFKCNDCGKFFRAPAAEWGATAYMVSLSPCPKCGSNHTYPLSPFTLLGPGFYRKIWETIDKQQNQ